MRGSAEFVPRCQAAVTAGAAVPPAAGLWRGCSGQSALPLGGSGEDPPRARHNSHLLPREPLVRLGDLDSTVLILLPMPVPYWSAFAHPGGLPGSLVGLLRHSRGGLVRFLPVM